ncbi:MAG: hypothetical protein HYV09_35835 [Deltaproteobacteria bacterium]|nr:hypothetical protein [Deltaproteobacteria bacterium]
MPPTVEVLERRPSAEEVFGALRTLHAFYVAKRQEGDAQRAVFSSVPGESAACLYVVDADEVHVLAGRARMAFREVQQAEVCGDEAERHERALMGLSALAAATVARRAVGSGGASVSIEGDLAHLLERYRLARVRCHEARERLDREPSEAAARAYRLAADEQDEAARWLALSIDNRCNEEVA